MTTNAPMEKLFADSLPTSNTHTHTRELCTLRYARKHNHRAGILLFDLKLDGHEYSVTLVTDGTPWLLVFNLKRARMTPLALKVFPGFRVATYFQNAADLNRLVTFFGISLAGSGSLTNFFGDMDAGLKFRMEPAELEDRRALLLNQDQPEEIDMIYFKSLKRNKKLRKDGSPSQRSIKNSWKTQQILPMVWAQIENDPQISVNFTEIPAKGAAVTENEKHIIQENLRRYQQGLI